MNNAIPQDDHGSVLLKEVEGVQLRLTQINRLFCITQRRVAFPSLLGNSVVKFDDITFLPLVPPAAIEAIRTTLRKQREIRQKHWHDHEDDESAWQYN